MFSLVLEATNLCNRNCLHCVRDKLEPRGSIPLDLAEKILKEARELGIDRVRITGGEIALYPDLEGLIPLIVDHGFRFAMVTNGYRFRERMLPLLCQPKVKKKILQICFSLDGARASSHDAIRGDGSFHEVMEAAMLCRLKEIPFGIKTVISHLNEGELTEIALLGATLGASDIDFIALFPTPRLIQEAIIPSPEELTRTCSWIVNGLARTVKITITTSVFYPPSVVFCCDAFTSITVDYRGNLVFCCGLSHIVDDGTMATPGRECLADLGEVSLREGITRHFDLLAHLMRERLGDADRLNSVTAVPCYWCLKRFGKLDWLRNYPDSPWSAGITGSGEPGENP